MNQVNTQKMTLEVIFDSILPMHTVRTVIEKIEATWPHLKPVKYNIRHIRGGDLIWFELSNVPGTYDDFGERLRSLAKPHGIPVHQVNGKVESDVDYWE